MTREIKFRAWDRCQRKMYEWGWCKDVYTLTWLDNAMLGEHEIMQFTGLKDKNEKEIYEGDLVVLGGKYPKKKTPQIIGYDAGYLSYGIVYDTGEMMRSLTPLEIVKGIEVIGNIYENPELIK